MKRKLILGFALAWALLALLEETSRAFTAWDERGQQAPNRPARWRFDTKPVADLAACVALVRERVPPGKVVVFVSPQEGGVGGRGGGSPVASNLEDAEFFRWRWAAFLLPEYEVAPIRHPR